MPLDRQYFWGNKISVSRLYNEIANEDFIVEEGTMRQVQLSTMPCGLFF